MRVIKILSLVILPWQLLMMTRTDLTLMFILLSYKGIRILLFKVRILLKHRSLNMLIITPALLQVTMGRLYYYAYSSVLLWVSSYILLWMTSYTTMSDLVYYWAISCTTMVTCECVVECVSRSYPAVWLPTILM